MSAISSDPAAGVAARGKQIIAALNDLVATVENAGADEAKRLLAAGKIQEIAQLFDSARDLYETILAKYPKTTEARARLALALLKGRNPVRALAVARQAVETDAKFVFKDITGRPRSAQTVLGDTYLANNDDTLAKEAYSAAVSLQPSDSYAAYRLAQGHLQDGEIDQAVKLSDKFLDGGEQAAFRSTINLLVNDPHRLPALGGVVRDFARGIAAEV